MKFKTPSTWVVCLSAVLAVMLMCGATFAGAYTPSAATAEPPITPSASSGDLHWVLNTATIRGKTWYLIDYEEQLCGLGRGDYPMDGKYLLNADIVLDKGVDWVPIGSENNPFTGVFNGNGFEIAGLTITNRDVQYIGMFGYAQNAEIYNVTLRNPDIESAFTPGSSIAPVLAFGIHCNSHDNEVIGAVDAADSKAATDTTMPYDIYNQYGLVYHEGQDKLLYNGQVVRYFVDRYNNGQGVRVMWAYDMDGVVDVHAVRNTVGEQGELIGVAPYSDEDFRLRTLEIEAQQDNTPDFAVLAFRFTKAEAPEHLSLWIQECESSPLDFQVTDQGGRYYVYVRGDAGFGFSGSVSDGNASMNMEITTIDGVQGDGYALFSVPLYSRFVVSYNGHTKSYVK